MMPLHVSVPAEQPLEEYDVLAEYMADRLSDIETKRFETRLLTDPQFFRRMAPFLSVLYPVEPPPIEIEVRQRVAARRAELVSDRFIKCLRQSSESSYV